MNEEERKNAQKSEEVADNTATSLAGKKTARPQKPLKKSRRNNNKLLYNPRTRKNNPVQPSKEIADSEEEKNEDSAKKEQEEKDEKEKVNNDNEKKVQKANNNSAAKVKTIVEGIAKIKKLKMAIMILIPCVIIIIFVILIGIIAGIVSSDESGNSFCDTSGSGGTLLSFLTNWEGGEDEEHSCDSNNYRGYDIGDGTVSIGSGMTNYAISTADVGAYIEQNGWQNYFHISSISGGQTIYRVDVGLCVPKDVINSIKLYVIENTFAKPIDIYAEKYNVELTQFQKDAITSFNYNVGAAYTESLISAYASGGYSALWEAMKGHVNACINGSCGPMDGLKKRRKAEFALFVTGDYSDQGLFYSRSLNNYDDYNSEGVLSRRPVCDGEEFKNYTKVTSSGTTDILTKPLKDKLIEKHTTYQEFNEYILNSVVKSGVGTRNGVVAAAVSLVAGLYEKYSIRLPYTYGGQHGYAVGIRNPSGESFYGVDPLWGTAINYTTSVEGSIATYPRYGPDCSGFVMWALHNGGMNARGGSSTSYYTFGPRQALNGTRIGDPGDLMFFPGHIMLVVGVDDEAKKYYIAHASGRSEGVKISEVGFSNSYYQLVKMDNYYKNYVQYTDAKLFSDAFHAGYL